MLDAAAQLLSSLLIIILGLVGFFLSENLFSGTFSAIIFFFENFARRSAVMSAATKTGRWKEDRDNQNVLDDLLSQTDLRLIYGEGDLNEKIVSGIGDFGFGAGGACGFSLCTIGGDVNQDQSEF